MVNVAAFEAKTQFSRLLDRARRGEEFTITHRGLPVARLLPMADSGSEAQTRAVLNRLRDRARSLPGTAISVEDLLAWRDEGRR